jgi:hypothetical protein
VVRSGSSIGADPVFVGTVRVQRTGTITTAGNASLPSAVWPTDASKMRLTPPTAWTYEPASSRTVNFDSVCFFP